MSISQAGEKTLAGTGSLPTASVEGKAPCEPGSSAQQHPVGRATPPASPWGHNCGPARRVGFSPAAPEELKPLEEELSLTNVCALKSKQE